MELIHGEVVVIPPSGGDASLAQTEVAHRLRFWQADRGGRVLTDVFIRVGDGFLAPDVAWWSPGREPAIGPGALATVPDLVVEVLSLATRDNDLGPKRRQYLQSGVRELWLVDPVARTMQIAGPVGDRRVDRGQAVTSSLLPGLSFRVDELFA
jgi:Uma2 family endonuclease